MADDGYVDEDLITATVKSLAQATPKRLWEATWQSLENAIGETNFFVVDCIHSVLIAHRKGNSVLPVAIYFMLVHFLGSRLGREIASPSERNGQEMGSTKDPSGRRPANCMA